jgi:hypothetical protein
MKVHNFGKYFLKEVADEALESFNSVIRAALRQTLCTFCLHN